MELPKHIADYFDDLWNTFEDLSSVWLFGSRVNGGVRPDSDWDFLTFGPSELLNQLKASGPLPPKDVSLMVVYDGENFRSPWPRDKDGAYEKRSLSDWKWTAISDGQTKYQGCKELPDGSLRSRWERAVRLLC